MSVIVIAAHHAQGMLEVDALIGLARLSAGVTHAPILTSPSCYSSCIQPHPPPVPQAVVAPPKPTRSKKGNGMRWKEPIGLTAQTKYGSQKAMRSTGGIVTSAPFSSTSQQPQVVTPQIEVPQIEVPQIQMPQIQMHQMPQWWPPLAVAPIPTPEPLETAAPLSPKTPPKRARESHVQWVPRPTSGRQLCGDGRMKNKNKDPACKGDVSPSTVCERELAVTHRAHMRPMIELKLLEADAPARPAMRVFWTKRSEHQRLADQWAGGDGGAATPPALTTASSSSASESDEIEYLEPVLKVQRHGDVCSPDSKAVNP